MIKNKNEYNIVKENHSKDIIVITCTKKKRECDICLCIKRPDKISMIKYPIIHKDMGRLIMTKYVCPDCREDVKEILSNLKYN